jgi:FkbM family methyltransferase
MTGTSYSESELSRLRAAPRHEPQETALFDPPLRLLDGPSFVPQYEEIFLLEIYDFPFDGPAPVIIDGGSNIGLAVIWWRARWPQARIIAFEPDPQVFDVMVHNLRHHHGLELHMAALSTPALGADFIAEGTDAGRLGAASQAIGETTTVQTVALGDILADLVHVDLLKLDIEGAETEVLLSVADQLHKIDRIFFEYHSCPGSPQTLADLLGLVREAGFRVRIFTTPTVVRPFRLLEVDRGFDMQCNVWAWRPSRDTESATRVGLL